MLTVHILRTLLIVANGDKMWQIKVFKTRAEMFRFISLRNIQWEEVFINNGYGVEYRPIKKIVDCR